MVYSERLWINANGTISFRLCLYVHFGLHYVAGKWLNAVVVYLLRLDYSSIICQICWTAKKVFAQIWQGKCQLAIFGSCAITSVC